MRTEAFEDRLGVVIRASARLSAVEETLQHHLLGAMQEENEERGNDLSGEHESEIDTHVFLEFC